MRENTLTRLPFLRILPIIVLGILTANTVNIPAWIVIILLISLIIAAFIFHKKEWSGWLVASALFMFAISLTYATATREVMPKGEKLIASLYITDNPQSGGRWRSATAEVDKYRRAENSEDEPWQKSGEKVLIRFDTIHHISIGDRIITETRLSPIGDTLAYAGYTRLMKRRGYSASAWVYGNYQTVILPDKAKTPMYYASIMQAAATERMDRLHMNSDALAVCKAMSIGVKQDISPQIRESYSLTGASHLLAVSGLHVGIVAMLVNLLLWLLPLVRRGHLLKNLIAVTAIWLYAMMTGLSPSVVRAAMMFTGLQLAMFSSRESNSVNILLATASVMLLINPDYLYDVSFQLSFAAVMGIFVLYKPMFSLVNSRWRWLNAVWSVILIGVSATLATAPLVSYYFGQIPVIGIFLNPIVIVTANIIVLFSVLWIIAPLGILNGIFSWILNIAGGLQNSVVTFSSEKSWASVPISMSGSQVIFTYLVAGVALYIVWTQIKAARKSEVGQL